MIDMAKGELEEVKSKLPELEETIRFMLIPKDRGFEKYRYGTTCWNRWR